MNKRLLGNERVRGGHGVRPERPAAAAAAADPRRFRRRAADSDTDADANSNPDPHADSDSDTHSDADTDAVTNYNTAEYQASNYSVAANAIAAYNAGRDRQGHQDRHRRQRHQPEPRPSSPAGSIPPAATSPATAASATRAATAPRSAPSRPRRATVRTRWASRSTRPSSACAPTSPGICATKDGCQFFDDCDRRRHRCRAASPAPRSSTCRSAARRRARACSPRCSARSTPGIVIVISAGNDGTAATPIRSRSTPAQQFPGIGDHRRLGRRRHQRHRASISSFSDRAGTGADYYLMARRLQRPRARRDRRPIPVVGHQLLGADDQRRGGADGAGLPQPHRQADRRDPASDSADDLGAAGVDIDLRPRPLEHRPRVPADRRDEPGRQPDAGQLGRNGDLPPASGDAVTGQVARRGHPRRLQPRLRPEPREDAAPAPTPTSAGALAAATTSGSAARSAGPVSIAMTVRERHDLAGRLRSRADGHRARGCSQVAANRRLGGRADRQQDRGRVRLRRGRQGDGAAPDRASAAARFLVASDIAGDPGFSAKRNGSIAVRREFGSIGVTFSGETGNVWQDVKTSATGSPYRLTSIAVDRGFGRNWLSLGHQPAGGEAVAARRPHERRARRRRLDLAVPRCRGAARFRQRLERQR